MGICLTQGVLRRRDTYYRQPPAVWSELRCSVVARSWKTIRGSEWKIALWGNWISVLHARSGKLTGTACGSVYEKWSSRKTGVIREGLDGSRAEFAFSPTSARYL